VATPSAARPGRTIAVLAVLTALIYGAIFFAAPDSIGKHTLTLAEKYQPRLGLDLEGGTSVILTPRRTKGSGSVPKDSLNQAVSIIRNRVDSFGVAESEVTTAGNNIVISIPGKQDKNILATVQQTAELRFRQVLVSGAGSATPVPSASPSPTASGTGTPSSSTSGTPSPSSTTSTNNAVVPKALRKGVRAATTPTPTPTGSASAPAPTTPVPTAPSADGITPALQQQFLALDCGDVEKVRSELRTPGADDPKKPLVTCSEDGVEKYILAPAEVLGTDVKSASATLQTNNQGLATGGWVVELNFTGSGKKKFADVTRRLFAEKGDKNRFAIVLDGLSVSAPATNGVITNGNAEISGNFSQAEATDLANVLKFGALPLTFDPGEVQEVSA
jgi:preprotein translocase subunit SecD